MIFPDMSPLPWSRQLDWSITQKRGITLVSTCARKSNSSVINNWILSQTFVGKLPLLILSNVCQLQTATSFGDSSLTGMGGYSLTLKYGWHIPVPEEVQRRTLLHKKDNEDGQLISINVLEFVMVIINYIAALHVVSTTSMTNDPYPVLLNVTDNATSALSWTLNACHKSNQKSVKGWPTSSVLINSPLGINSKWIRTHNKNTIADEISCMKLSLDACSQLTYDYSMLQQTSALSSNWSQT